jgi:predicted nucleotidyltransferase
VFELISRFKFSNDLLFFIRQSWTWGVMRICPPGQCTGVGFDAKVQRSEFTVHSLKDRDQRNSSSSRSTPHFAEASSARNYAGQAVLSSLADRIAPLLVLLERRIKKAGTVKSTTPVPFAFKQRISLKRPMFIDMMLINMKSVNGKDAKNGLKNVLAVVSRKLPAAGVDCILIGGFAVNYYGYTRNTLDLDFMIVAGQFETVRRLMKETGFTNITCNKNVAFFNAPGSSLRVDFLFVDENTMRTLLANVRNTEVYGFQIKVPALIDLIAMKIFSFSRDIERRLGKDLPDIAYLTVINNLELETDIRPLCNRFGSRKVYDLIRSQVNSLRES